MPRAERAKEQVREPEAGIPRGYVRLAEWRLEERPRDWVLFFLLVLYTAAWLFGGLGAFFNNDPALRLGRVLPGIPLGVQIAVVAVGVALVHELLHALSALIFRSRVGLSRGWAPGFLPLYTVAHGPLSRDAFILVQLLSPVLITAAGLILLSQPPGVRTLAWIGLAINAAVSGGDIGLTVRVSGFPGESLVRFAEGRFEVYAPGIHRKERRPGKMGTWREPLLLFSALFLAIAFLLSVLTAVLQRLDVSIPFSLRVWIRGVSLETLSEENLGVYIGFWPSAILGGILTWAWMAIRERRHPKEKRKPRLR